MESRFDAADHRFETVSTRLETMDRRLDFDRLARLESEVAQLKARPQ